MGLACSYLLISKPEDNISQLNKQQPLQNICMRDDTISKYFLFPATKTLALAQIRYDLHDNHKVYDGHKVERQEWRLASLVMSVS